MSSNSLSQGAKANLNGKIFEDICIPIFKNYHYAIFQQSEIKHNPSIIEGVEKYIIRNAEYTTIYNHKGKTEFVIVNCDRRIRVENKYQASAGSVDEKFVFTLLNAIEAYQEKEAIIIIDGGGYKEGAREWVRKKIEENWLDFKSQKDIKLMNIQEFIQWCSREL